MKLILAAATAATFVLTASVHAGGLADAVMEDEIIVIEETERASLPEWVIPLAIVGIVIAVASSGDDDGNEDQNLTLNVTLNTVINGNLNTVFNMNENGAN